MSTDKQPTRESVLSTSRRIKRTRLLLGALTSCFIVLTLWLGLFLVDNLLSLPSGIRLPLALGGLVATLACFWNFIARVALRALSVEATARLLEQRAGLHDNAIINACLFEKHAPTESERPFFEHVRDASAGHLGRLPMDRIFEPARLRRAAGALCLTALVWSGYLAAFTDHALNAGRRFALPLGDTPNVSKFSILVEPSGALTLYQGGSLDVNVRIDGPPDAVEALNPVIVWQTGATRLDLSADNTDQARVRKLKDRPGEFVHRFGHVMNSLAFRVFAADTYSKSVALHVVPLPKIDTSSFRITPPPYTGLPSRDRPGPPGSVTVLPGTELAVRVTIDAPVGDAVWQGPDGERPLSTGENGAYETSFTVDKGGDYTIEAVVENARKAFKLAAGEVGLLADATPRVEMDLQGSFYVTPGSTLSVPLKARDDHGLRQLSLHLRTGHEDKGRILESFDYLGPPGRGGEVLERYELFLDPDHFTPGSSHTLQALAYDFNPAGRPGRSKTTVLRVKDLESMGLAEGDPLSTAFEALRQAIRQQENALGGTDNLAVHLADILKNDRLGANVNAVAKAQQAARDAARKAMDHFVRFKESEAYARKLDPLVEGEMPWVIDELRGLDTRARESLPDNLARIETRQRYILSELVTLMGRIDAERAKINHQEEGEAPDAPPTPTVERRVAQLHEDLNEFTKAQEKIIERTRALLEQAPEDMSDRDREVLGELAREEAEWAEFLEERLTDFSKLPQQDFGDGSMAEEFNEVFQEVKKASEELYAKNVELAVPMEQAGLENAEELKHNLERWLPDTPDHTKWSMEEMPAPVMAEMAELPSELEDIVGELLDSQESMTDEVEDLSSSWMDSLDKGAGWGTSDGPISNMSARGVSGNTLPNENEIGGRSGEGRTGRSHGQMVESAAEGKEGRETPTRLTPQPYEAGQVDDSSTESTGGATGGGKVAGFAEAGLRGPSAPPSDLEKAAYLQGKQAKIRQRAEALALQLRQYNVATGRLESAAAAMGQVEAALDRRNGLAVRQSFSRAVDQLDQARASLREETGVRRAETRLPSWMRDEIRSSLKGKVPEGYEAMVQAYFKSLATGEN